MGQLDHKHAPTVARLRLLTIAFVLAAGSAPSGAAASDSKYFNGSFCRALFPFGASSTQGALRYGENGSVANASLTQAVEIGCPIVRDILPHDDGWDSLEIGYFDKRADDAISCSAWAGSMADGSLFFDEPGLSVDTAGSSWHDVNMNFGQGDGGFVDGYYWIRCVLPPAPDNILLSGIAYYRIQES